MIPLQLWLFLHLFFAFAFVGSLMVAEWCGRAARRSGDWKERALLFDMVRLASGVSGLGTLLMLGIFGNLLAAVAGYRMATGAWLRGVNALWIVAVVVTAAVSLPGASRLARMSRDAAGGNVPEGYDATLRRWRLGNLAQTLLYLALLALMVWRPQP